MKTAELKTAKFLLKKVDDKWLKFVFSFILIFSGIRMFF